MTKQDILNQLIPYHNAVDYFDYSYAVEWAIKLVEQGNTNEDILMLASFAEPIDKFEIQPYTSRAIKAEGLEEKTNVSEAENSLALLCTSEIIENKDIRKNLRLLKDLCFNTNYKKTLMPFLSLQYTWEDFDFGYCDYPYYDNVTIDTIEDTVKKEAKLYVDNFDINDTEIYVYTSPKKEKVSFFKRILSYIKAFTPQS